MTSTRHELFRKVGEAFGDPEPPRTDENGYMTKAYSAWETRMAEHDVRAEHEPPPPGPETREQAAWREVEALRAELAAAKERLAAAGEVGIVDRIRGKVPDRTPLQDAVIRLTALFRAAVDRAIDLKPVAHVWREPTWNAATIYDGKYRA